MPIAPSALLTAAKELQNKRSISDKECSARTVAGRSYYAVYLEVREAVRAAYRNPAFDTTHSTLAESLEADSDPDVNRVGTLLRSLFAMRSRADYRIRDTLTEFDALGQISSAEEVFKLLPRIRSKIPLGIPPRRKKKV